VTFVVGRLFFGP